MTQRMYKEYIYYTCKRFRENTLIHKCYLFTFYIAEIHTFFSVFHPQEEEEQNEQKTTSIYVFKMFLNMTKIT